MKDKFLSKITEIRKKDGVVGKEMQGVVGIFITDLKRIIKLIDLI